MFALPPNTTTHCPRATLPARATPVSAYFTQKKEGHIKDAAAFLFFLPTRRKTNTPECSGVARGSAGDKPGPGGVGQGASLCHPRRVDR